MKNKLWIIVTLFLFILCPNTFANIPYSITVGNIPYTTSYPVIEKNNMIYLSDIDFNNLTFSSLSKTDKATILTLGREHISFTPNDRIVKINGICSILKDVPLYHNKILYIPLSFLDILKYDYTLDSASHIIKVPHQAPRSINSDDVDSHTFLETSIPLHQRVDIFKELESSFLDALTTGEFSNQYIAFIDNKYKQTLFNYSKEKTQTKPYQTMEVVFRDTRVSTPTPSVSSSITLPLTLNIINDQLVLNIGNQSITSNCILTSYIAGSKVSAIDLDKSFDLTIMNMLYQHYRNTYDFKDDKYFSPFLMAEIAHSNFITYPVYANPLPNDSTHIPYIIKVYRTHMTNKITYIIDVLKK